ncbi:MAG: hypothetical protein JNM27_06355 [Leptospirales bacterium]|nr:hypothetical protein [Leptospirales bacterium]
MHSFISRLTLQGSNRALLLLSLAMFCLPKPEKTDARWKRILTTEQGAEVVQLRAEGLADLLVYAGTSDSLEEISPASDLLLSHGWNLMALRPVPGETQTPESVVESKREFFRFADARPGFRRKVLLIYGQDLQSMLDSVNLQHWTAIIVLRPDLAGYPDLRLQVGLSAIRQELPMLFLTHPNFPGTSYIIYGLAGSKAKEIQEENLLIPQKRALFEGRLLTFLLRQRYTLTFIESRQTFKSGCKVLPDGPWVIGYVSGERAEGFCPLFLKSSGDIFRAVGVLDGAMCDYGLNSAPMIRCR